MLTNCDTSSQRYVISCTASVLSSVFARRVVRADISCCDSAAASVAFLAKSSEKPPCETRGGVTYTVHVVEN